MADEKQDQGWQSKERIDAEIAADISKDRNMLDYVAYNNNGKAFVTLAGIMKVANEVGLTVSEINTEEVGNLIRTIVEVRTPKDENGEYQSAWSGRDEFKIDHNSDRSIRTHQEHQQCYQAGVQDAPLWESGNQAAARRF